MKKFLSPQVVTKKFLVNHEVGRKTFCNSMATELKKIKIFFQSGLTDVGPVKKNFKFLKPFLVKKIL
jgi:hypothetical protein